MDNIRTYTELMSLTTYQDRLAYLMLRQNPTERTFGGLRELNQSFYSSHIWKQVRNAVIVRDNGRDLGMEDFEIPGIVYVHHMNPITPYTLQHDIEFALDPEYLITVSFNTHQHIHFSKNVPTLRDEVYRSKGDTRLW